MLSAFSTSLVPSAPSAKQFLLNIGNQQRYDLIWASGWDFFVNIPLPGRTPVLADPIDDGVLEHWLEFRHSQSALTALRMIKRIVTNFAFERRFFGRSDRVLFVSERDANVFSSLCPGVPVSIVNNGVDTEFFQPSGGSPDSHAVIFEGNLGFAPNADGVLFFLRKILPLIRLEEPSVEFWIVGADPPHEIGDFASEHIHITDFVEDVRPFVDRASVFVCPLRKGAGIKNKVLQAWSMAKPVVATKASVGGLRVREGENIVVRSDPAGFAQAVIELIRNPEKRTALGQNARQTVIREYTWQRKAAELEEVMLNTAKRRTCSDKRWPDQTN